MARALPKDTKNRAFIPGLLFPSLVRSFVVNFYHPLSPLELLPLSLELDPESLLEELESLELE